LSGVFGRKAGSLESFHRYSPALRSTAFVWSVESLDAWLKNPAAFVPGNWMTFAGVENAQARADLVAYLKSASISGTAQHGTPGKPDGGMMGMGGGAEKNLKTLDPEEQVRAIGRCEDSYRVTTGDGLFRDFWERNLRFETDSSARGPERNKPVILPAGMLGDRSTVIFAQPDEISGFIQAKCPQQ
jgi:cytochrome c